MTVQLARLVDPLEPGDEREFSQDEAIRLVAAGYAVPVVSDKVETAVLAPPPEIRIVGTLKLPERGPKRNRR
jgi:hypothetical protein